MRVLHIIITLLITCNTFAQDEEGTGKRKSLFEVIRKDNSLFKKVPQLPKTAEENFFSKLRTSLFLGKRFGRQDLTNQDLTTESYYNDDGTNLGLGLDYYLHSWLSFSYYLNFNKQKRKRYDGFQVSNDEKNLLDHNLFIGADYGNLFLNLFYFQANRYWPLIDGVNSLVEVDQSVSGVTLGSRIFLSDPIAIDLFYSYGLTQSLKSSNSTAFEKPHFSRIGARIYWASKMHFGIELYEEENKARLNGIDVREKNFALLPYWRF